MRAIEIFRLRRVRDKALALNLMQLQVGLSAEQAREVLNLAMAGGRPQLTLPSDESACWIIVSLLRAGLVARFAPAADFDAAACAEAAMLAVVDQLPSTVSDQIGTMLLREDWAAALELCVQTAHLLPNPNAAERLRSVALTTGVIPGIQGRA